MARRINNLFLLEVTCWCQLLQTVWLVPGPSQLSCREFHNPDLQGWGSKAGAYIPLVFQLHPQLLTHRNGLYSVDSETHMCIVTGALGHSGNGWNHSINQIVALVINSLQIIVTAQNDSLYMSTVLSNTKILLVSLGNGLYDVWIHYYAHHSMKTIPENLVYG